MVNYTCYRCGYSILIKEKYITLIRKTHVDLN